MAINMNATTSQALDGSDASIDNIYDGGGTRTIWAQPEGIGENAGGIIFDKRDNIGGIIIFQVTDAGGSSKINFFQDFSTTDGIWILDNSSFTYNSWNHCGFTYDNDSVANNPNMFIDGTDEAITETSTPVGTRITDAGEDYAIGSRPIASRTFDGDLFYNASWTVILSATEMAALARGVNPFVMRNEALVIFNPLWDTSSPSTDNIAQTSKMTLTTVGQSTTNPPVELIENCL